MAQHYFVGPIYYEQWLIDNIWENKFINPTSHHWVQDPKGERKVADAKKKALYTVIEVFELYNEI